MFSVTVVLLWDGQIPQAINSATVHAVQEAPAMCAGEWGAGGVAAWQAYWRRWRRAGKKWKQKVCMLGAQVRLVFQMTETFLSI